MLVKGPDKSFNVLGRINNGVRMDELYSVHTYPYGVSNNAYTYIYVYIYVYIYMYIYMYIYVYIYVYLYLYMYSVHIQRTRQSQSSFVDQLFKI